MRSKIARCAGSPPGHGKRGPLAKWQVERRRLVKSAPEIIGTALAFHYINRTVDVFLEKSPMELPSTLAWAKGPLTKVAASTFAKAPCPRVCPAGRVAAATSRSAASI